MKNCASSEPTAPPVMMMGPSAPNGPPDPMDIAADTGFSTATLGSMREPRSKIDSSASGIPCPRMRSEPYRAINPTITPPTTGTRMTHGPKWCPAGVTCAKLIRT